MQLRHTSGLAANGVRMIHLPPLRVRLKEQLLRIYSVEKMNVIRRLPGAPLSYFGTSFIVCIIAFWPSFFSKLSSTDSAHLVHGVSATLWMVVPIWQAWLIKHRQYALHRRLGWGTLSILAPALVLSGLHMVQLMVLRYQKTHALRLLKFTFLDLSALSLFIVFLVLAVLCIRRKDLDGHIRYMAGTVILTLEPVLERVFVFYVPGVPGFAQAAYYSLITLDAVLAVLLWFEWRRGRVRLPFTLLLIFFVMMHALMTPVAMAPTFSTFVNWIAAI